MIGWSEQEGGYSGRDGETEAVAQGGVEGDGIVLPVNDGIVAAEPGDSKDDRIVADAADIEGGGFAVGADAEGNRDRVSDRARGDGLAIDDVEQARNGFWDEVELVLRGEPVVNEE